MTSFFSNTVIICVFVLQVTRELPRLTIPNISLPIEGGPGSGNVEVESLNLLKFESPKFQFMLAPNKGITWNSRGGALRLKGLWKADYTFLAKVYYFTFLNKG